MNVGDGAGDVWLVPLGGAAPGRPLLADRFTERDARVSSDGRWIAYASNESGAFEVSVRSLSGPPQRVVVSSGGGDQPVWRRDGAELFFVNPQGQLHAVSVRVQDGRLLPGAAVRLGVPPLGPRHWGTTYDVSPDGKRIHLTQATGERPPRGDRRRARLAGAAISLKNGMDQCKRRTLFTEPEARAPSPSPRAPSPEPRAPEPRAPSLRNPVAREHGGDVVGAAALERQVE